MPDNTRPWGKRAEELRETEGDGCDIAAWREWLMDEALSTEQIRYANMLLAHGTGEVWLYGVCCGLADGKSL